MMSGTSRPVPESGQELPPEVVTCLKNARYLHLATTNTTTLWPHVSLMNYTYLPTSPYPTSASSSGPIILLTVQPTTKKAHNLVSNPRVSLLVHDWVSHRSSFSNSLPISGSSPPQRPSSLADLLTNINTAALSSISATLFGYAEVVEKNSEAERYYRRVHQENNSGAESSCYLEGEDVAVVVVRVAWARVADYKGFVRDWVAEGEEEQWKEFDHGDALYENDHGGVSGRVNGVENDVYE